MQNGTILAYADDCENPRAEIVLRNGDHVRLTLDRGGLVIKRVEGVGAFQVFQADPHITAQLCAALCEATNAANLTPLRILVAAVAQLSSAKEVSEAFGGAADSC